MNPSRRPRPILPRSTLPFLLISSVVSQDNPQDSYCGLTWSDAFANCPLPCPSRDTSECRPLGDAYECFPYTGCRDKDRNSNVAEDENVEKEEIQIIQDNYCGETWIHAMMSCSSPCPLGTECSSPQKCWAATNCHVPLESLQASLLVPMNGPDRTMDTLDGDIFGGTVKDVVGESVGDSGIRLDSVDVGDQTVWGGRALRWNTRTSVVVNSTHRRLPSGSSALDVSVVVTGEYRPPPYLNLDVIAEDSINRGGEKMVSVLQERGLEQGRDFFERVSGIRAVAREKLTGRPTSLPTGKPTKGPTGEPTVTLTAEPSVGPSDYPSSEPSRTIYNSIMTGSRKDLNAGSDTTSSYGYLFNMRTKRNAGVVLITGMSFYTQESTRITLNLWSRMGNFLDYKNSTDGWDLIASGSVKGSGVGSFTVIPQEMFTPVDIPGGGGVEGTRAFYLTLSTNTLEYKFGDGEKSDETVQIETPDLVIREGEAVLTNPLPDPSQPKSQDLFRFPRQYLGIIHYDRLPCKPFEAYGVIDELPCPGLPTQSPTLPPPSSSPVSSPPSFSPVTEAPTTPSSFKGTPVPIILTESPTLPPSISRSPTFAPSTSYPSSSPIVPMRANIVVNLRNVPERAMSERESGKFIELTLKFLEGYTENSMAIEGIDIWYQQQIFVDAPPNSTAKTNEITPTSERVRRQTLKQEKIDQIVTFRKKQKEEAIPQITAVQVTLILRIPFAYLPEALLGEMVAVVIQEHGLELILMLQEESAFYTYFKSLDGITSESVLELTPPPTPEPTVNAVFRVNQLEDAAEDPSGVVSFGVMVGLAVAFLWCTLTGCSIIYLLKARARMLDQKDLENLLKKDAASSVEDKSVMSSCGDIITSTSRKFDTLDRVLKTRPPSHTKRTLSYQFTSSGAINESGKKSSSDKKKFLKTRSQSYNNSASSNLSTPIAATNESDKKIADKKKLMKTRPLSCTKSTSSDRFKPVDETYGSGKNSSNKKKKGCNQGEKERGVADTNARRNGLG